MTLVTLGTQHQEFTRLLDYIEKSDLKGEIIVQAGYTKYESKRMKIFDFISYDEMEKYIDKSDLVITHAGTGSIVMPLKKDKKVIACARLSKFGEHVDDHQVELVDVFYSEGYILKIDEDTSLNEVLKNIKNFKPKKFVSNTNRFIENLEQEINK